MVSGRAASTRLLNGLRASLSSRTDRAAAAGGDGVGAAAVVEVGFGGEVGEVDLLPARPARAHRFVPSWSAAARRPRLSVAASVAEFEGESEEVLAGFHRDAVLRVLGDDKSVGAGPGVNLVAAHDGVAHGPAPSADVLGGLLEVGGAVAGVPVVHDDAVGQPAGGYDALDGAGGRIVGQRFGRHRHDDVVGFVEGGLEDRFVFEAAGGVDEDFAVAAGCAARGVRGGRRSG